MRKTVLSMSSLLVWVFTSVAVAQQAGMGMGPYDLKTETTVIGTVQAVQQHPGHGRGMGTHLLLKTTDKSLDVHVGSSTFIDQQGFSFAEGDKVEILGSLTKTGDAILARVIKKNGKSLTLRDDRGKPLWAGGRKRT